ncbi:MAG: hypothetical protein ACKPKO_55040, partial [Candidatus Fonsibacter sp.]
VPVPHSPSPEDTAQSTYGPQPFRDSRGRFTKKNKPTPIYSLLQLSRQRIGTPWRCTREKKDL